MQLGKTLIWTRRWEAAVYRHAATWHGMVRTCPIRKCRRDGYCTGPMLVVEGAATRLAGPDSGPDSDELLMPLCHFYTGARNRHRAAKTFADVVSRARADNGHAVFVPDRALAARRYRRYAWPNLEESDDVAPATGLECLAKDC